MGAIPNGDDRQASEQREGRRFTKPHHYRNRATWGKWRREATSAEAAENGLFAAMRVRYCAPPAFWRILVRGSAHLLRAAPDGKIAPCATSIGFAHCARRVDRQDAPRTANRAGCRVANRRKSSELASLRAH
ncbi:MAG: hypothetical protein C0483_12650 [Pirellula sp.]|nr:hypothetical protein [Pirellula sp.]